MNNILDLLAKEIRARRKGLGLSQEEFAAKIGVSSVFVSKIERGIANPTVSVVEKMANFFNMPISELFSSMESQALTDSVRIRIMKSILDLDEQHVTKVDRMLHTLERKAY